MTKIENTHYLLCVLLSSIKLHFLSVLNVETLHDIEILEIFSIELLERGKNMAELKIRIPKKNFLEMLFMYAHIQATVDEKLAGDLMEVDHFGIESMRFDVGMDGAGELTISYSPIIH